MSSPVLKREVGLFGAVMMGLGSILGTGVFVSIGIAAGVIGPAVVVAIVLAAGVALCNALSSAQLAANHPVSGGTYEYGYRYLKPWIGFSAGWLFVCAKSASAAAAALGFAGYLLAWLGVDGGILGVVSVALASVLVLVIVVLMGIRRSSMVNTGIVSLTLLSLGVFVLAGFFGLNGTGVSSASILSFFDIKGSGGLSALFYGTALMFVAYTGYGRIATLGEEVRDPRIIIPRAIGYTLLVSAVLYIAVGVVAVLAVGTDQLYALTLSNAAPLVGVAHLVNLPFVGTLVSIGAMTAMLGVLLNLILGLSRTVLAMGRRGDLPEATTRLNVSQTTPYVAVVVVGVIVGGLTLFGDIKLAWSFSAFTVLMYYSITNLSALMLGDKERLYPSFISWIGLGACLFLAFWVDPVIWVSGLGLIGLGLLYRFLYKLRKS